MGVAEGFELEVYVLDRLFQLPSHSCSTEIWELYMFRRPMNHKVNIFLFLVLRQRLAQDIRFFWRSRDVDFLPIWSEEMAEAFPVWWKWCPCCVCDVVAGVVTPVVGPLPTNVCGVEVIAISSFVRRYHFRMQGVH